MLMVKPIGPRISGPNSQNDYSAQPLGGLLYGIPFSTHHLQFDVLSSYYFFFSVQKKNSKQNFQEIVDVL